MENEFVSMDLPGFLSSFENLSIHFDEHFGDLGSNERGDNFLSLAEKIIPLHEKFTNFPLPTLSEKKTHDGGVDLLTSENDDGQILCGQSKYKIRDKSAFDTIISKFKNYEAKLRPPQKQETLFSKDKNVEYVAPVPVFVIITSSKLERIRKLYEESTLASKLYYDKLLLENRLTFLDGPEILKLLQQLYRKSHLIPANIDIDSFNGWIHIDNVYIGAVSGKTLTDLYTLHGDALFFENIRDFLGVTSGRVVKTRSTVNQEIINTLSKDPHRMLSRNNGITFRSTAATPFGKKGLKIEKAAIVNGCQTTMCLVQCQPVPEDCQVLVKIVVTDDAWDIAKATNYQNEVARIDLDLARYLRPQLVRRIATTLGYAIETSSESNASAVLNTIYQFKVDYEELRYLYLGLFSRKPNNIFDANYTELRADVLEALYELTENEEKIFIIILMILKESREALEKCKDTFSGDEYAHLFKRFYKDDKPRYRSFLAIAAICAAVRVDISCRSLSTEEETERMNELFGKFRYVLENSPNEYHNAYKYAFATVADTLLDIEQPRNDSDIQQSMFYKISSMAFNSLFKRILVRIDVDASNKTK